MHKVKLMVKQYDTSYQVFVIRVAVLRGVLAMDLEELCGEWLLMRFLMGDRPERVSQEIDNVLLRSNVA